jgi:hypothetical protein
MKQYRQRSLKTNPLNIKLEKLIRQQPVMVYSNARTGESKNPSASSGFSQGGQGGGELNQQKKEAENLNDFRLVYNR